jgi:16S rRNA processing protein RimM
LIIIGKISGCFGVKGFVKVRPVTHASGRLSTLASCFIGEPGRDSVSTAVAEIKEQKPEILMRFAAFPDRTAAETIVGKYLMVDDGETVPPPPGSWFIHEIIGCTVETEDGKKVGVVEDVLKLPAQDVWSIRAFASTVMFPVVKDFIVRVDTAGKKIVVRPPEGLLSEEL